MNIRTLIILVCIVVSQQNCKKPEEPPQYFTTSVDLKLLTYLPDSFLCTATKEVPGLGSVPWVANCLPGILNDKLAIGFITYEDSIELYARERLTISNIPARSGLYSIKPFEGDSVLSVYSRWLSDGDVLNALWELDTNENNYIEINELNSETHLISGKFDLNFKMTVQGSFGYVHSERINFKSGKFVMRYPQ